MAKNSLVPKSEVMRVLVEESGLTHGQIAVRAGCNRSTVTRIIRGERRIAPELAAKIAKTLGVRTEVVFRRPGLERAGG